MITMSDFVCLVCDATLDASSCTNVFYSFLPRSGEPLVNFLSRVLRVAVSDLRGSYVCSQCSNLFEMLEQAQRTVANICCEIFKAYRGNARLKNQKERSTGDEAAPPDRPFTQQQQQQQQPGPDIPDGGWLKEAPGLSSVTAGIQEKIAKVQAEEQRTDSVITGMNEQLGKTGNRAESVFPEDKSETRVIPETVSFGWNGIEDNITEDITKEMTDISNGLLPVEEREVNRIARLKSGKLSKGGNGKALKYSCPTCGKKWRTSAELKTHIKTHSTLKPYMCEKCGQAYKHKHALEIHVGMHNGINPFKCSFCNKCFTQKGALMRHLPMHTGERPYQCELCGKRFIHHTSYNMHRLSHTGKKSYKCHVCELSLLSTSHLKRHMRVHTGEKPYNCAICGKRFAERYNLLVHQKIHDPSETKPRKMEKPRHKCSPCNLTFERKQSLDSNFHPEGNTEIEAKEYPVQSENLLGESWPQINRSKLDVIDGQTKFMLLQNPLTQIHDNSLTVAFANDKILENGNYNASLQVIIQSSDASVLGNHIALDNTQI